MNNKPIPTRNNKSNKSNKSSPTSKKKYKSLESRRTPPRLSIQERSSIQNEINSLQAEIEEAVKAYKLANPDKEQPQIQATTNNSNILSKSSNPTKVKLNSSIPTSDKLIKTNIKTNTNKSSHKKSITGTKTLQKTRENTSTKLIKH